MVNATDQEMTATEEFVTHSFQEIMAHRTTQATWGSSRVGQEAEREGGKRGQEPIHQSCNHASQRCRLVNK